MFNKSHELIIALMIKVYMGYSNFSCSFLFSTHEMMMTDSESEKIAKFKSSSNIIVTGQSHAGKTTFVFSLLKHMNFFESNIGHILYAFGMWQPLFERIEREISSITFVQGIPDKETLERFTGEYGNILLVLDDVMGMGVNNIEVMNLFTTYSHHMGITVLFLLQNVFPPGKYMRTISLNAHYIILFKNSRDEQQVKTLARQIFPNQSKYFMDAYKKATDIPYSYLCVTLYPGTAERNRLSSNIFPEEDTILYLPM